MFQAERKEFRREIKVFQGEIIVFQGVVEVVFGFDKASTRLSLTPQPNDREGLYLFKSTF